MKIPKLIIALNLLILVISGCQKRTEKLQTTNLLCEYLENPIGLDTEKPRFRWQISTSHDGFLQTGYELYVGTDSLAVSNGEGNIWESGTVEKATNLAVYNLSLIHI